MIKTKVLMDCPMCGIPVQLISELADVGQCPNCRKVYQFSHIGTFRESIRKLNLPEDWKS